MENQNGGPAFIGRDIVRDSIGTGSDLNENVTGLCREIYQKQETRTNCEENGKQHCCFPTTAETPQSIHRHAYRGEASSKSLETRKFQGFARDFKRILKMIRKEKERTKKPFHFLQEFKRKLKGGKSKLFRTITSQPPSWRALQHTQLAKTNIITPKTCQAKNTKNTLTASNWIPRRYPAKA